MPTNEPQNESGDKQERRLSSLLFLAATRVPAAQADVAPRIIFRPLEALRSFFVFFCAGVLSCNHVTDAE